MKDKTIFALKAKRKIGTIKNVCSVLGNIYGMISLVYSHCKPRSNKWNWRTKKKKKCDVDTSEFIEQVFQFIFTFERVSTVFGVRADVIEARDDDELARFPPHIGIMLHFKLAAVLKTLFILSAFPRYDAIFGLFRSYRNWLFDLFISLFYSFSSDVLSVLNMMNVSSTSRCICNEAETCDECKFFIARTSLLVLIEKF